jgi:hypothetical protein
MIDYIQYDKYYLLTYGKESFGISKPIEFFLDKDQNNYMFPLRHKIGGPAFISRAERSYYIKGKFHRLNAPSLYQRNYYEVAMTWHEFGIEINKKYL